jgi:hypothetical protein
MLQVYEELLDEDDFFTDSDEFSEIGYEDPYVKRSNKEIKDHLLGLWMSSIEDFFISRDRYTFVYAKKYTIEVDYISTSWSLKFRDRIAGIWDKTLPYKEEEIIEEVVKK